MKMSLDITKPRYSEQILPVPYRGFTVWTFQYGPELAVN